MRNSRTKLIEAAASGSVEDFKVQAGAEAAIAHFDGDFVYYLDDYIKVFGLGPDWA